MTTKTGNESTDSLLEKEPLTESPLSELGGKAMELLVEAKKNFLEHLSNEGERDNFLYANDSSGHFSQGLLHVEHTQGGGITIFKGELTEPTINGSLTGKVTVEQYSSSELGIRGGFNALDQLEISRLSTIAKPNAVLYAEVPGEK